MRLKKTILLLVVMVLFSCFSLVNVRAEEEIKTPLDETILNEESLDVKFVSGIAIVMGNLSDNLTVAGFFDKLAFDDSFALKYDIQAIQIEDASGIKQLTDTVTSNMKLVIQTNDETTYEYEIKVVGDLNDDGIVNNEDVNIIADDILNNKDVSVINDINGDGVCDILDVTQTVYSIDKINWEVGEVEDITLTSELNSLDEVYVGDPLEVTYKIKGYDLSKFKGISGVLNYDKSLLKLDSVFISSDYGRLNDNGKFLYVISEETDEVVITLNFNVIAAGNTSISIADVLSSVDGVKVSEETLDASKDIIINEYGKGGDEDSESEEVADEPVTSAETTNVETTATSTPLVVNNEDYYHSSIVATTISLSNDNYIKSLTIKNYKIDFDKERLEYSIEVGNKVNSLELDIVLNDKKASYEVVGNKDFKVGKNVVSIIVTAEDGSVREYKINVDKKGASVETKKSNTNGSKIAVIVLIGLIIAGLVYVIFKDDDEEDKKSK